MTKIKHIILFVTIMLIAFPAAAQDGRINPSILTIAIYCANGGLEIWDVGEDGQGQQALAVSRDQINNGVAAARDRNQPVTIGRGSFGITLVAVPGKRLIANQDFEGKNPYSFEFNADTCGPLELPAPGLAQVGNFAPGVVVDDTASPITPSAATNGSSVSGGTGELLYTVQRGDTLNRIARRFGVTISDITAINSIPNPNQIFPGQQILIPNQVVERPTTTPIPENNSGGEGNAPTLVDNGGNFLRDASFEGPYTGRGRADFNIPAEWNIQVISSPRTYEWQNLIPVAFPHTTWVMRDGASSLNMNKGFATFTAVLSQQVTVPENANLEASVWAWYHTCDAGSQNCDNRSNPIVRVGISPTGGTNPFGSEVVWSGNSSPQGGWGLVGTQAQAQGSVVTMFIYASQDTPRTINELYFDQATLRQTS